jgi:ribonuclease Z
MMKPTDQFAFPDGTLITGEEAVTPPRMGRKVVVCGDTADASGIAPWARDCDVLVHEATNAFLQGRRALRERLRASLRCACG